MFHWKFAVLVSAAAWSLAYARADETSAHTATRVTLDEAVARAINASASVGSRQELIAGTEAGVRQSGVGPNPEIKAELENIAGSGSFRGLNDSELTLGLSQRIERSGKRDGRVAVAVVERDIATIERDRARLDVALAARRAYVDAGASTILMEIAQTRLESATQIEAMAVRRVGAARDPITVKLRAEIQTAQARNEYESARLALQTAKKRLGSLWGEPSASFSVETSALRTLPEAGARPVPDASPDVRVSEAAARRAASKFELENANARSDFSVGLAVRRFESGGDLAGVVSISVPIAIFDTNQGNIERAEAERRAADLDVIHTKSELELETLTLQGDIATARAEAAVIRSELLPRAEAALKAARHGYNAGAFSYLELSESQRTLNELRTREVEVLRQLQYALAGLDRLTGRLIVASSHQGNQK